MDASIYIQLIKASWRELIHWRNWVFSVALLLSFSILGVGFFWQEKFETSAMLYADSSNIIEPLLKGKAVVTNIDSSKAAKELIYTRRILRQVVMQAGLADPDTVIDVVEEKITRLRGSIIIQNEGKNFFRIIYSNKSPDLTFKVLNSVVDAFIKDSSASRRQESRGAFEFIDQQVAAYKRQLLLAESKLKEFKSSNLDGTEGAVVARINQLRLQIEEMKLKVAENAASEKSIKSQLARESKVLNSQYKIDEQLDSLKLLRKSLDSLRLVYQETYPDIVSLKEQVKAQEVAIEAMQGENYVSSSSETIDNPLYEELRKSFANIQVEGRSQENRLASMTRMLGQEYERAKRVASKEAELAELVRDNDVTRNIYEEMLGRKEKARLSMALDMEGQGVSYKIQEPAVYPLVPSGIRFIYFAALAPIIGLLVSIGGIILYVILDPRSRSAAQLMNSLPAHIELLVEIPHVNTLLVKRLRKFDMLVMLVVFVCASSIYTLLVWGRTSGTI